MAKVSVAARIGQQQWDRGKEREGMRRIMEFEGFLEGRRNRG